MKTLSLSSYGVEEMNQKETIEISGGNPWGGLFVSLLYDIVSNWSDSKANFKNGAAYTSNAFDR